MEIKINKDTPINLEKLVDSKLLIQANSGGGKSWAIRRILEQSHGKVQHIIIDPEGEFSTLREKYEYILAGKGNEVPITTQSAALLALRLLEFKASAVIDLYELNPQERRHFVRLFLESMVNSPKELHHPVLVVLDEAHMFAPEKGESEALGAVIDLASRGRKRGFGVVLATQRISKLHKDAAAECNNKLIGRTGLDIDRKRAAEEIGFTSKEDVLSLRTLEPGEFYAFGPAISAEVIKLRVGEIKTSHPKAGARAITAPVPPTDKIKGILAKLSDLPQEAKKQAQSIEELKGENKRLKNLLATKNGTFIEKQVVDQKVIDRAVSIAISNRDKEWIQVIAGWKKYVATIMDSARNSLNAIWRTPEPISKPVATEKPKTDSQPIPNAIVNPIVNKPRPVVMPESFEQSNKLGKCPAMIYSFLFKHSGRLFNKKQICAATGYSLRSSGFANAMSELSTRGLIQKNGEEISLGESRPELAVYQEHDFSISGWLKNLGKCPRDIYKFLLDNNQETFSKESIAQATNYSMTSSGFANAISALNSTGLISKDGQGIRLNPELLEI